VTEVRGGITNLLYRLEAGGESRLVRIYGENTEVLIDREQDTATFAELAQRKFAPWLFGEFANGRVEQWLPMRALEPSEMGQRAPVDFVRLIAIQLARMHGLDMPGERKPTLWETIGKWEDMAAAVDFSDVPSKAERFAALDLPALRRELEWLRGHLPSPANGHDLSLLFGLPAVAAAGDTGRNAVRFACAAVFGHNDLLSGNVLVEEGTEHVQIVDYEYGAFQFRAFDFANHFCEYAGFDGNFEKWYPSAERQVEFLDVYLGASDPDLHASLAASGQLAAFLSALQAVVDQFALASHYFWGLWAILQARHSPIDFDFMDYAHLRFTGYQMHKRLFVESRSE